LAERPKSFFVADGNIHASQENLLYPLLRSITSSKRTVDNNLQFGSFTTMGDK